MRSKLLLGGLLASVVVLPVVAQQSPAPSTSPAPAVRETTPPAPPQLHRLLPRHRLLLQHRLLLRPRPLLRLRGRRRPLPQPRWQ